MAGSIKYDTLAVFVSPNIPSGDYATGDIRQLHRIQSSNYNIEIQREDIRSLGTLNPNDGVMVSPFVNLSISYLVTDGENEKNLGFIVDGRYGALKNIYSGHKDYFLLLSKEPEDMVMAIGNGVLTRYTVGGQINDFLRSTVDIRGFNIKVDAGTSGNFIPSVDTRGIPNEQFTYALPPYSDGVTRRGPGLIESNLYISPRNISAEFPNGSALGLAFSGDSASYLQSFQIEIGLPRSEINRIGDKYPFQRCLELPIDVVVSADFIVSKYLSDRIQNYLCQDDYDLDINILDNQCSLINELWEEVASPVKLKYSVKGLKLRNQEVSASVSDKMRVSLQWGVKVGNLLDLEKNFFISGDFGRYEFPVDSFSDIGSEPSVTGFGLMPLEQKVVYKRVKADAVYPNFELNMMGEFDIHSEDEYKPINYYSGDAHIRDVSGDFGEQITVSTYKWNADAYSTIYDAESASGFSYKFSNLNCPYPVGYPEIYDTHTGINEFYVKSKDMSRDQVFMSIANVPSYINASVKYPEFTLDPYQPFKFNEIRLEVADFSVPTGHSFEFDVLVRGPNFKKAYRANVTTPRSYHITLPNYYSGKTSFWLEPYNEDRVMVTSGEVSSIYDASYKRRLLVANSGLPQYQLNSLSGKSYINFEGDDFLQNTGVYLEDFRTFTIFSVTRNSSANSGAQFLNIYNSSGDARFTISQSGNSETLTIESIAVSGASSGIANVVNAFPLSGWNLTSIQYKDNVVTTRINGSRERHDYLSPVVSGRYDRLDFGKDYAGDVAEFIVFPYQFSDSQVENLEKLLQYKWGI